MEDQQEVSLLIEDEVFKVKKDLLCEYSDYFRAMFSGNYVEKKQQEIRVDVLDSNSMKIIIRYMELGLIDLSDYPLSTIGDIAFAANFLQITELMKQIHYCLGQQLSMANWIEIKGIAHNAPSINLEQEAVIFGLFAFKSMKPRYIPTIQQLFWYLSHPYLNTDSELHVFKFGLQWIEQQAMGADTILIILSCLDMSRITSQKLHKIRDLLLAYANSLAEKVVDCLYKLVTDFELTLPSIKVHKPVLCEMFTEKVYTEVLNLVSESIQRKLKLTPAVPMWSNKIMKTEKAQNFMNTFTEEDGFQNWIEITEKNLWGWNITNWTPTKLVMVCGEHGRGTGSFMRDVKVYDVHKEEWIRHGVELPVRRHAGVVIVEDTLFILGGVGAFRVVLDSAIAYDLKQQTFRKIAKLPDALQGPAVCAHENEVYVVGLKHIYKFIDIAEHQWWEKVAETKMTPNYLVSFKGYIYVAQNYFCDLYRFKPGQDVVLQQIACFTHPPLAMCSLGNTLFAITGTAEEMTDLIKVEEFQDERARHITQEFRQNMRVIWTQTNWAFGINPAGSCAVALEVPPANPEVSEFHQRYLTMYGTE